MKQIPLKTIEAPIDGQTTRISYKAQLFQIMRVPSDTRGADMEEIRKSLRVMDALEKVKEDKTPYKEGMSAPCVELEDADFEYMKQRVLQSRWPIIDKFIMTFIEDVTNA